MFADEAANEGAERKAEHPPVSVGEKHQARYFAHVRSDPDFLKTKPTVYSVVLAAVVHKLAVRVRRRERPPQLLPGPVPHSSAPNLARPRTGHVEPLLCAVQVPRQHLHQSA